MNQNENGLPESLLKSELSSMIRRGGKLENIFFPPTTFTTQQQQQQQQQQHKL